MKKIIRYYVRTKNLIVNSGLFEFRLFAVAFLNNYLLINYIVKKYEIIHLLIVLFFI